MSNITIGIIVYCVLSVLFTIFILALFRGASSRSETRSGAPEGAWPDRFEEQ